MDPIISIENIFQVKDSKILDCIQMCHDFQNGLFTVGSVIEKTGTSGRSCLLILNLEFVQCLPTRWEKTA